MRAISFLSLALLLSGTAYAGPSAQLSVAAVPDAAVPSPSPAVQVQDAGPGFRCLPPAAGEEVIYQSDFHWNYSLPEMKARFKEMYSSPKRLDKRAYWSEEAGGLVLPPARGDIPVKVAPVLVKALSRHIERALELGYADTVFFPDMGHSHLLIPLELWESRYSAYPLDQSSQMYTDMFSDPAIHIFYHTAEQLKMLEDGQPVNDEAVLFRRANRNIAGPIAADAELTVYQNPESAANTVHDVPGYRWWGAGFNFSAQKDGCFSYTYKGQTYRYDISLQDLPMKPGNGGWDEW